MINKKYLMSKKKMKCSKNFVSFVSILNVPITVRASAKGFSILNAGKR